MSDSDNNTVDRKVVLILIFSVSMCILSGGVLFHSVFSLYQEPVEMSYTENEDGTYSIVYEGDESVDVNTVQIRYESESSGMQVEKVDTPVEPGEEFRTEYSVATGATIEVEQNTLAIRSVLDSYNV